MMPALSKIKRLKPLVGLLLAVGILLFIGRYLSRQAASLPPGVYYPDYRYLATACIWYILYFLLRICGWVLVIRSNGLTIGRRSVVAGWVMSEAARYIPGSIWSVVGRVSSLRREGLPTRAAISCWVGEMAITAYASALLGATVLLLHINVAVALITFIFGFLLYIYGQRYTKPLLDLLPVKFHVTLPRLPLPVLGVYLLSWSCFGLGAVFVTRAFQPLSAGQLGGIFGASILSWLIGYLSIITPLGLGVREGAFVFLTAAVLTSPAATVSAIMARICLILSELVLLVGILSSRAFTRRR